MSTLFLGNRSWKIADAFCKSSPWPFYEGCFFADDNLRCLEGSNIQNKINDQISGGKKRKKKTPFVDELAGALRARAQKFNIYLPRTAWTSYSWLFIGLNLNQPVCALRSFDTYTPATAYCTVWQRVLGLHIYWNLYTRSRCFAPW